MSSSSPNKEHEIQIPLFKVFVAPEAAKETAKTLHSGFITQGPKVEELEIEFSKYLENPYTLTLNSATSAHHLALHLLKKPLGQWPGLNQGWNFIDRFDVYGYEFPDISKWIQN